MNNFHQQLTDRSPRCVTKVGQCESIGMKIKKYNVDKSKKSYFEAGINLCVQSDRYKNCLTEFAGSDVVVRCRDR